MLGRTLGHYRVDSELGAGGMGVVYLGRDTRLGRQVAIKLLHDSLVRDGERMPLLEREARVLATLNHANIAAIYGLEDAGGTRFLALEYVPGETLAERLQGGPMPLQEALEVARQIADALDAAHEKGIVHRDLKPANIKITPEGQVKVLDFGLAKALVRPAGAADASQMDTVAASATHEGVIAGTPAYMSPEQARGRPVDRRTDIWAFGCVLYEMLTGRATFAGETITDTLAAVLEHDPDWSQVPASTPAHVRRLLQRCLERDARTRLRDIGDARIDLQPAPAPDEQGTVRGSAGGLSGRGLVFAAGAAVMAIAVAAALGLWPAGEPNPGDGRVSRFMLQIPDEQVIFTSFNPDLALSPDGTKLAFATAPDGVFIRSLDGLESELLEASTGYSTGPVFSPDGLAVAYVEGNAILSAQRPFVRAALSGGAAVKLTDYDMFHAGDWGADGWIYWTATYPGGIVRIPENGGDSEPVTQLDLQRGDRSHRFANLLPGGQALIYAVGFDGIDNYDDARIDLWDMRTQTSRTLISGGTAPVYSPSGHIVYARAGKLLAVPFDAGRLEVTGTPFEALDGVLMSRNTGMAQFSLSDRGDLAYIPGPAEGGNRSLVWVDRNGVAEPLPLPPASYVYPRISPDGRMLAVEIEGPNHDLHVYDIERGILSKVTTDGLSHDPVWTPDGRRFVYRSWLSGGMTMWSMPADRSGPAERLDPNGMRQSPVSVSPDGKFLAFDQKSSQTEDDIWFLPLDGTGAPQPFVQSRFGEGSAKFSPDGRWLAYSSDESGDAEIYVQAFPGPGPKIQVSSGGGIDPMWRPLGGELYYRGYDGMMVVEVATSPEFRASKPRVLWAGDDYSSGAGSSCGMPGVNSSNYSVTPEGDRFLMVRDDDAGLLSDRIVVVVNWAQELTRLGQAAGR